MLTPSRSGRKSSRGGNAVTLKRPQFVQFGPPPSTPPAQQAQVAQPAPVVENPAIEKAGVEQTQGPTQTMRIAQD